MPRPMSEDEILNVINMPKIDLSRPANFEMVNVEEKYTKDRDENGRPLLDKSGKPKIAERMIVVDLFFPDIGGKQGDIRDWLLPDSDNAYSMLKFRRFMCSIGMEPEYMEGKWYANIIGQHPRTGSAIMNYVDNTFIDSVTGLLVKNKKYVISQYVPSEVQGADNHLSVPEFKEDADIPF